MANIRDLSSVAPADMAVLEGLFPSDWPEVWGDFARVFYIGLCASKELAAPRDALARAAIEQVHVMGFQLGGSQPYIPRGTALAQRTDNARIRHEFKGNNYGELAARYGLSESRVRQIINQQRRPDAGCVVINFPSTRNPKKETP